MAMSSTTVLDDPAFKLRVATEFLKSLGVPRRFRDTLPDLVELGKRHSIEQPPTAEKDKAEYWQFADLIVDLAQAIWKALGDRRIRPELVGINSQEAAKALQRFAAAVEARDAAQMQNIEDFAKDIFQKRARRPQFGEIRRIVKVIRGIPRKTRRQILRAENIPGVVLWSPVLGTLLRVGLFFYRRQYTNPEFLSTLMISDSAGDTAA